MKQKFEDAKGVIWIRRPKNENRQYNCQKKKYEKTNTGQN
jgi:hypothetical protein